MSTSAVTVPLFPAHPDGEGVEDKKEGTLPEHRSSELSTLADKAVLALPSSAPSLRSQWAVSTLPVVSSLPLPSSVMAMLDSVLGVCQSGYASGVLPISSVLGTLRTVMQVRMSRYFQSTYRGNKADYTFIYTYTAAAFLRRVRSRRRRGGFVEEDGHRL